MYKYNYSKIQKSTISPLNCMDYGEPWDFTSTGKKVNMLINGQAAEGTIILPKIERLQEALVLPAKYKEVDAIPIFVSVTIMEQIKTQSTEYESIYSELKTRRYLCICINTNPELENEKFIERVDDVNTRVCNVPKEVMNKVKITIVSEAERNDLARRERKAIDALIKELWG